VSTHTSIAKLDKPARNLGIGTIVATVNLPDRDDNYPALVVLVEVDSPRDPVGRFSTHVMYFVDDAQPGDGLKEDRWVSTLGHYDLTWSQAWEDFKKRHEASA